MKSTYVVKYVSSMYVSEYMSPNICHQYMSLKIVTFSSEYCLYKSDKNSIVCAIYLASSQRLIIPISFLSSENQGDFFKTFKYCCDCYHV